MNVDIGKLSGIWQKLQKETTPKVKDDAKVDLNKGFNPRTEWACNASCNASCKSEGTWDGDREAPPSGLKP